MNRWVEKTPLVNEGQAERHVHTVKLQNGVVHTVVLVRFNEPMPEGMPWFVIAHGRGFQKSFARDSVFDHVITETSIAKIEALRLVRKHYKNLLEAISW